MRYYVSLFFYVLSFIFSVLIFLSVFFCCPRYTFAEEINIKTSKYSIKCGRSHCIEFTPSCQDVIHMYRTARFYFQCPKEWKRVGDGLEFDLSFLCCTSREAWMDESQTHKT
jgi:hypothetical protein